MSKSSDFPHVKSKTHSKEKEKAKDREKHKHKEKEMKQSPMEIDSPDASSSTTFSSSISSTSIVPVTTPSAPSTSSSFPPTFSSLQLSPRLLHSLSTHFSITSPTPIQYHSFPHIVSSRNVLIRSETGSGKTLAYLLPIVHRIIHGEKYKNKNISRSTGPLIIIIVPTRELASQIHVVSSRLLLHSYPFIVSGVVTGGTIKSKEKDKIRKGLNLIVATPGRLLDHLENSKNLICKNVESIVLDEADRLLDMGFGKEVGMIIDKIKEKGKGSGIDEGQGTSENKSKNNDSLPNVSSSPSPQIVLVSATLGQEVHQFANDVMQNHVEVGGDGMAFKDSDNQKKNHKNQNENDNDNVKSHPMEDITDLLSSTPSLPKSSSSSSLPSLPSTLLHRLIVVDSRHRLVILSSLLRSIALSNAFEWRKKVREMSENNVSAKDIPSRPPCKRIVFVTTCASVEFHYELFKQTTWPPPPSSSSSSLPHSPLSSSLPLIPLSIHRLHGNLSQSTRTNELLHFLSSPFSLLLCTDVASRGLDLPHVDYIIHYDIADELNEFIHRAGRTARMGKRGESIIFLRETEKEYIQIINAHISKKSSAPPLSFTDYSLPSLLSSLKGGFSPPTLLNTATSPAGAILQRHFETITQQHPAIHNLAISAYTDFLRAAATYSKILKTLFNPNGYHYGHVARSFGLVENPMKFKMQSQNYVGEREKENKIKSQRVFKRGREEGKEGENEPKEAHVEGKDKSGKGRQIDVEGGGREESKESTQYDWMMEEDDDEENDNEVKNPREKTKSFLSPDEILSTEDFNVDTKGKSKKYKPSPPSESFSKHHINNKNDGSGAPSSSSSSSNRISIFPYAKGTSWHRDFKDAKGKGTTGSSHSMSKSKGKGLGVGVRADPFKMEFM